MAVRILVAAALSAVLMFLWGFVFWGVLDVGSSVMEPLPAELDVLASLRGSQAASGMYVYPMPADAADPDAVAEFERKHQEGPLLQLAYVAEGGDPMPASMFVFGLAHYFLVSLLAGCMLAIAGNGLRTFGRRFAVLGLFALAASLWANAADAIWWFHPLDYCLGNGAYQLVAGLLMAVVVAALVKRPAAKIAD